MKKLIAIASLAMLGACSGSGEEDDGATEGVTEEVAADEQPETTAGTYTGLTEEGQAWISVLRDDGTYEDSIGGEVTESGTWAEIGEQVCFYPTVEEGAETQEDCFTLGLPNDEGLFIATNAEGRQIEVTKVGSSAR